MLRQQKVGVYAVAIHIECESSLARSTRRANGHALALHYGGYGQGGGQSEVRQCVLKGARKHICQFPACVANGIVFQFLEIDPGDNVGYVICESVAQKKIADPVQISRETD